MNSCGIRCAQLSLACARPAIAIGLFVSASAFFVERCEATSPTVKVIRVEEDWELILKTPDANSNAPQVTTVISPNGNVDGVYASFEVNYQGLPVFQPGGLQLQVWDGESPLDSHKFPKPDVMSTSNETITWTQSVQLSSGSLTFEIINGNSQTWGSFGGQGYLKATVGTSISNLINYSPNVSVDNSGVGFAGNRVASMTLKKVRWHLEGGTIIEDANPRSVPLPE